MSEATNINDNFFNSAYKEVWRKLTPPGLTGVESAFLEEVLRLEPGQSVVDLMCGYGRHAIELARKGYSVTAIDNLQAYISELKQVAEAENLSIEAAAENVLTYRFNKTFDAAICMGNSFAFFNKANATELLSKTARQLKPGGRLVLNSWMTAEIALKHFKEKEWLQVDGFKYLMQYRYQFFPSRIESEHTLIAADGKIETLNGVDYIFSMDELDDMMKTAGLEIIDLFSTPKKKKFTIGDPRIYIVSEKISS